MPAKRQLVPTNFCSNTKNNLQFTPLQFTLYNLLTMKKPFIYTFFLWAMLHHITTVAQVIVTTPAFPTDNQPITITFDATQGSGGLASYTGDVYAHTGVITNLSSSNSDWKYVKTNWGQNTAETKLTSLGNHLYSLQINPSVRQYYNVPAAETILKMAFVFRSATQVAGQWLEGKTDAGGDIFADIYEASINVQIFTPDINPYIVQQDEQFNFSAGSSYADSMFLYLNNTLITSTNQATINQSITATNSGVNWLKVAAKNATSIVYDSAYFFVRPPVVTASLPAGIKNGPNYVNDNTVILALYAPFKEYAFVIGDMNDWQVSESAYMNRTPDGNWYWLQIDGVTPQQEYAYQYFVDGTLRIADPYTQKVLDPWNDQYITPAIYPNLKPYPTGKTTGIVSVFQTAETPYEWQNTSFVPPSKTDLVVYELLVRDFTTQHSYQAIIDTLQYLKTLGINAIELMPVTEFEGNQSWGYNISFMFAGDKYYGTKNDLKQLIDEAHGLGIAVIFDIVLNHQFGQSPLVQLWWNGTQPATNSPYFNPVAKHDFNVGYDMNHESAATKQFFIDITRFWIQEYHADGYRFDLSKGFTQINTLGNTNLWGQYDQSRINIWKQYADSIWLTKPDAYLILEHLADNSEEKILANYGLMLWGNMNYNYAQNAMAYSDQSDISWASYKTRLWNDPHLISYMESHDEERMAYRCLQYGNQNVATGYNIKNLSTALQRIETAAAFYFTIPGPKMIWQFGELGYDYSIDYNGRTGNKPVRWDYYYNANRKRLYDVFAALIKIKTEQTTFETTDFSLSVSGLQKRINLNNPSMNLAAIGNFAVTSSSISANFQHTGTWYNYFTGDAVEITNQFALLPLQAGEYKIFTDQPLSIPDVSTGMTQIDPQNTTNGIWTVAYPNPSNIGFTIEIEVTEPIADVQLQITNLMGQHIATLYQGKLTNGGYALTWDANTDKGAALPQGTYLYKLQIGDKLVAKKLMIN